MERVRLIARRVPALLLLLSWEEWTYRSNRSGSRYMKKTTVLTLAGGFLLIGTLMFSPGYSGATTTVKQALRAEQQAVSSVAVAGADDIRAKQRQAVAEARKKVVAQVNGVPINMYSLVRTMNRIAPKYLKAGQKADESLREKIRQEALDRLIGEELAVQEARRLGLKPPEGAVDAVIMKVKSNLGSAANYRDYLERFDITEEELRKQIARDNILNQILKKEVASRVKIDESAVRKIYEKERSRYTYPEDLVVTDVKMLPGEKPEILKKHAEELLAEIKRNHDNDPWKLVLDGTFLVRKLHVKKERNPGLYSKVTAMEEGQLSGVIEDTDGFHIVKVVSKKPERVMSFEEARPRIEQRLKLPAYRKRRAEFYNTLRQRADVVIMQDQQVMAEGGHMEVLARKR